MGIRMTGFFALLKRELLIAYRNPNDVLQPLLFFIIVTSLFPLGLNPETEILRQIAPAVIWVSALLAALLSFQRLFYQDFIDGTLDQFLLSQTPLPILLLAKVFAHWLIAGLPLILVSPILALLFHLQAHEILVLDITLLLGTPTLCLLGLLANAFTVGIQHSGLLLSLIILPLTVPILIFATSATANAMQQIAISGQLAFLAAIAVLFFTITPWIAANVLTLLLE